MGGNPPHMLIESGDDQGSIRVNSHELDVGAGLGGAAVGLLGPEVCVLCSVLSCRAIIEAVGGDVLLTSVAVVVGGDVPGPCLLRSPC